MMMTVRSGGSSTVLRSALAASLRKRSALLKMTTRREVVASEAGYELEFDVWPEALFSRVKRIGLEPTD